MKSFPKFLGLTLLPQWRVPNLPFSSHLSALFDLEKIDCVLDVGANDGGYRDFLRQHVGYEGAIVSFEPIPKLAEVLRKKSQSDAKWKIIEVALANEDGQREFNIMASSQFSSFLTPDHSATPHLIAKNNIQETAVVRVAKLASIFEEITRSISASNFYLKLDTQGYDLEVLRGAIEILPHIKGMQTELSMLPIYGNMPDYRAVLNEVESLGFCISHMFPVNHDPGLRAIEFDCVLVRGNQEL